MPLRRPVQHEPHDERMWPALLLTALLLLAMAGAFGAALYA